MFSHYITLRAERASHLQPIWRCGHFEKLLIELFFFFFRSPYIVPMVKFGVLMVLIFTCLLKFVHEQFAPNLIKFGQVDKGVTIVKTNRRPHVLLY